MNGLTVAAMPGEEEPASRFARLLGADCRRIDVHVFPDGETRVTAPPTEKRAAIYCSLNQPNGKLAPLLFAASALRDRGAGQVILVAPYLAYMRQDKAFAPGESVSQKVIGDLFARAFDCVLTVEPHLHRVSSLDDVFGAGKGRAASAAPLLAEMIRTEGVATPVLVGPDAESASWTERVAKLLQANWLVLSKERRGDRKVELRLVADYDLAGKRVCLIDDIASSGGTLKEAAKLLKALGAARVEAHIVHALMEADGLAALQEAGIDSFLSTDSVRHPTNRSQVAPLLAAELKAMLAA